MTTDRSLPVLKCSPQILVCAFGSQWSLRTAAAFCCSTSISHREPIETKSIYLPNVVCASNNATVIHHLRLCMLLAIQHVQSFPPRGVAHATSGLNSSLFSDNIPSHVSAKTVLPTYCPQGLQDGTLQASPGVDIRAVPIDDLQHIKETSKWPVKLSL